LACVQHCNTVATTRSVHPLVSDPARPVVVDRELCQPGAGREWLSARWLTVPLFSLDDRLFAMPCSFADSAVDRSLA
jgi:hypothetical protein